MATALHVSFFDDISQSSTWHPFVPIAHSSRSNRSRLQHIMHVNVASAGCKRLLEKLPGGSSDATVGAACLLYKEGNYEEARKVFTTAVNSSGYQPELAYNIALCYYQIKQYGPALKHIAEIIEKGVKEHPELSVGAAADGAGARSVGNSQVLSNILAYCGCSLCDDQQRHRAHACAPSD